MDRQMSEELAREIRKALEKFTTGVQVAITISCFSIGVSLGVGLLNGGNPVGAIAAGLGLGLTAAAAASYSMYRAELRKAQPAQNEQGEDRDYHGGDEANYGRLDL